LLVKNSKEVLTMAEENNSSAVTDLIEKIEKLSVLELNQLVKALEEKFGVSAVAMAAPVAAAASSEAAPAVEEKNEYDIILTDTGANKIAVIKAIREINPNIGLKEAKEATETTPKPVAEKVAKDAANEAKKKLEAAGAKVELK